MRENTGDCRGVALQRRLPQPGHKKNGSKVVKISTLELFYLVKLTSFWRAKRDFWRDNFHFWRLLPF